MRKYINEISKGANLEMNLPVYADYLMGLYNKRAAVEFAMDYYTFQEICSDDINKDEKIIGLTKKLNDIVADKIVNAKVDEAREEAIAEIDDLRNSIFRIVEVLTAYADAFSIYEYVINRYEYNFRETENFEKFNDEEFTRKIMQYIFSDEDNAAINGKICEIIAELPLRMTKNKFFELLSGGMSVYNKTDKKTIDDFMFILKSSAMLKLPEGMQEYEDLYEIYENMKKADFKENNQDNYNKLRQEINYVASFIEETTSNYMMLQGLVNKAYVMLIALPYTDREDRDTACAFKIIDSVNKNFYNDDFMTLSEEITDQFVFLEGVPEKLQMDIQRDEYVLDDIKNQHMKLVESIMSKKIYDGLFIAQKLLQDSLFMDLNDASDNSDENDDFNAEEYLEKSKADVIDAYTEFFKLNQKPVNRAVMATTLSKIPVFFNNITEVQDYVFNSLSGCTNKAEKMAAVDLIKEIIENA